jgi:hypothetical protein
MQKGGGCKGINEQKCLLEVANVAQCILNSQDLGKNQEARGQPAIGLENLIRFPFNN